MTKARYLRAFQIGAHLSFFDIPLMLLLNSKTMRSADWNRFVN